MILLYPFFSELCTGFSAAEAFAVGHRADRLEHADDLAVEVVQFHENVAVLGLGVAVHGPVLEDAQVVQGGTRRSELLREGGEELLLRDVGESGVVHDLTIPFLQ